ncbi:ABC transporter ATP-binding protein [Chelatococcus asaccharovorans]|uniref:Putative spermidine/putrescine transport system ATP-binding protein n=1 Tax=Chelatococcus asaccharovorans TaxID=28210 RepID=A0A2V3U4V3_9HYPH|nr:ABC transporter ATP-binding protein [Chelatococcus asaccharovorans]MBS7703687.1 ABC transporter ATP-binding protein [Chelatococcus asaccharovorans]PXW57845.1 putative spermidine/putrescine transport system ATP-binding protein [Chelatococcus asaccharovorans]
MAGYASCRLDIDGIRKTYAGGVVAVDDISLTVEKGEVLALLGPSGCGKTTLLQSIAGFVTPDRGDIALDGQSILTVAPERRRTAMMFQHYALFPHMSVRDNIGFGLKMMKVAKPEAVRRIDDVLRLVRIEALAERMPSQLSGGQRQRVALARAVVTEPRMLLLDEPLGALDQNLREEMQSELRKLQQRLGLTTVMVTHDQREAIVLSDRIAVMHDGKVEQIGTARDIYDHPCTCYVANFTGVENLLPAERGAEGVVILAGVAIEGIVDPGLAARKGAVTLAVRSEAISLSPGVSHGAIPATVTFVQMLGASMRYEVELDDGTRLVVAEVRRETAPYSVGDKVSARFAANRCSILEA